SAGGHVRAGRVVEWPTITRAARRRGSRTLFRSPAAVARHGRVHRGGEGRDRGNGFATRGRRTGSVASRSRRVPVRDRRRANEVPAPPTPAAVLHGPRNGTTWPST